MTFRHLECALEVARAGSISQASKKLLVSQPYLSGMINSLEQELGCRLFIRERRGISLTPQGTAFMEHAEKILAEMSRIRELSGRQDMPLNIVCYYSRFMTQAFYRFHNQNPAGAEDKFREMGNMEVIRALANRQAALGIIFHAKTKDNKFQRLARENGLVYHTLFPDMATCLIMSDKHPLAREPLGSFSDLKSHPLVFFDDESTILYMMDHLKLSRSGTYISVADRGAFMDALLSHQYYSVINTPRPEAETQFVLRDIAQLVGEEKEIDFDVTCAYLLHKDHRLNPREKAFLEELMKSGQG